VHCDSIGDAPHPLVLRNGEKRKSQAIWAVIGGFVMIRPLGGNCVVDVGFGRCWAASVWKEESGAVGLRYQSFHNEHPGTALGGGDFQTLHSGSFSPPFTQAGSTDLSIVNKAVELNYTELYYSTYVTVQFISV
jgi:hypothetical protein